jgi:membrane protein YqaA with SNARE-associated domain
MAARHGGRRFVRTTEVPTGRRAGRFRDWFERYGMLTVFFPALLPIPLPLKVFVISAGVLHTPVAKFVGVIAVARVMRYFGEAWLGMEFGRAAAEGLGEHKWLLLGVALAFGAVSYLILKLKHRPEETAR